MAIEKEEACPRCGATGDAWDYDCQHCQRCESSTSPICCKSPITEAHMEIDVQIERIDNGYIVTGNDSTKNRTYYPSLEKFAESWVIEVLRERDRSIREHELPDFEREFRYFVLKFKDINKYLNTEDKEALLTIARKVDRGRCDDDKMPLNCVVVESDWPEYEPTWAAIEKRMKA